MKTGLRNFINKYSFLLTLLITINVSAQIHINGFCRYRNYLTEPGYTSLLPLNYNNDAYTDLFLYTSHQKQVVLTAGDINGDLSSNKEITFRYGISSIKNLSFGNTYSSSYLYVSRKQRTAGLLKFNSDGRLNLLDEYRFASYPENIDVADAQMDQAPDVLVSGPSFDGISILKIINGKISEYGVVRGRPFKSALFLDFTNDGYKDIAAVNLYNNSIDLFRNDTRGRFEYTRSIALNYLPNSFLIKDIDLDGYEDIFWTDNNNIHIQYGDAVSGYAESLTIRTDYFAHLLVTGDYNRDGLIDLVYADTTSGIITAVFAEKERKFSEELILLKKSDIVTLVSYYSKFINGIAALGKSGNLYVVDNILSFTEEIKIASGIKPGAISGFDNRNDGITDICYIDEENLSINFIIRDAGGVPDMVFRSNIHQAHKEITIDNLSKEKKMFYCWSRGHKLIEVITADFGKAQITRQSLYTSDEIQDVKIQPTKEGPAVIYSSYLKNGVAGGNVFEFHDFRYRRAVYHGFALNVQNIGIYVTNKEKGFFTWQKRNNLELYRHNFSRLESPQLIGKIPGGDISLSLSADLFNNDNPTQLAYLNSGSVIVVNNRINVIKFPDSVSIRNNAQFWVGEVKPGGLKKLFLYDLNRKSLNLITLFNRRKNLILSELISGINVNRYFVRNLAQQNNHIIYTDPVENCITIKRIK